MKTNSRFEVSKIKQLGDRVFEKILADQNIDAFNGAQGRILYVLWAKNTRFQGDRDIITIPGVRCHPLDPSSNPAAGVFLRAGRYG